ncbi:MAG TPA: hypothetical protein VNI02_09090, partial [Blastocatellia bacterium]|nr:hypothetical protein [Blastocatellia bacterium]
MFSLTAIRRFIRVTLGVYLLAGIPLPAYAQGGFSSGSTGADGAFSPTTSQTIQVPESGVFNYTTVNIPSNVTITYVRNAKNTPVTILASGNVTINGVILLSGVDGGANGGGGLGGPGGFNGGAGGFGFAGDVAGFGTAPFVGVTADGPGGGGGGGSVNGADISGGGGGGYALPGTNGGRASVNAVAGQGGPRYGATTLLPLIGGSGGGGGGAITGQHGGAGGGGGGAILIASSTTITMTGTI